MNNSRTHNEEKDEKKRCGESPKNRILTMVIEEVYLYSYDKNQINLLTVFVTFMYLFSLRKMKQYRFHRTDLAHDTQTFCFPFCLKVVKKMLKTF